MRRTSFFSVVGLISLLMVPMAMAADAVLTWQAPTVTATAGLATGYKLYSGSGVAACAATGSLTGTATIFGNVLTATQPNLTEGTTYCWELSATNAGGEGPRSLRVTKAVPVNPPGAPTLTVVIQ